MIGRSGRCTLLGQSPEALRELGLAFEERAGIIEYHGGLPRAEAERLAWREVQQRRELFLVTGRAHDPSKGPTAHWRPPRPDRDALAT
jgi:hypothetical protein